MPIPSTWDRESVSSADLLHDIVVATAYVNTGLRLAKCGRAHCPKCDPQPVLASDASGALVVRTAAGDVISVHAGEVNWL